MPHPGDEMFFDAIGILCHPSSTIGHYAGRSAAADDAGLCTRKAATLTIFNALTAMGGASMRFKSLILSLTVVGAMAMPLLCTAPAQAQASRTWVSGVGDDVNPCSRTAPCKTWAGAISKTAGNGEISVLDPGGFGAVTITKSIS